MTGSGVSVRKIDRALADMQAHLDWLRDHRSTTEPDRGKDICREIGVMEGMDTLRRHGAKLSANPASTSAITGGSSAESASATPASAPSPTSPNRRLDHD